MAASGLGLGGGGEGSERIPTSSFKMDKLWDLVHSTVTIVTILQCIFESCKKIDLGNFLITKNV